MINLLQAFPAKWRDPRETAIYSIPRRTWNLIYFRFQKKKLSWFSISVFFAQQNINAYCILLFFSLECPFSEYLNLKNKTLRLLYKEAFASKWLVHKVVSSAGKSAVSCVFKKKKKLEPIKPTAKVPFSDQVHADGFALGQTSAYLHMFPSIMWFYLNFK